MVPNGTTLLTAKATIPALFNNTLGINSTLLIPTYISQEEFLALQSSNLTGNVTLNDTGPIIVSWYPSGYSPFHIILASVVVTVLMIMVVVGNMLVIIAIVTEKALKNIQNWFIASLAVSDFFLGLIIMPFSLANELMGYWIFGFWWCEIHSAMDVLLCTASIMNLCLISLDRYWSITQAVDYLKKRTPARAAFMIAAVWLLSAIVCIPPLLGWRVSRPLEQFPQCKDEKSKPIVAQKLHGLLWKRVASGYTSQRDFSAKGDYYVEIKVSHTRDALSKDGYKNTLITYKSCVNDKSAVFKSVNKAIEAAKKDFKNIQPILYPREF